MSTPARIIAWAERGQETLLRDAIHQAELELIAIGSVSSAAADALSKALDVPRVDDLRQAIQREDVDLLWLAAPQRLETDERRLIREVGIRTISNEPRPVEIADLISNREEATTATFVPLMRRGPGYRRAMDALDEFAAVQCVNVCLGCAPGDGSLLARLFDAMDLVDTICGTAETIDAALAGPLSAVPESPADLHGHMTANIRFAENCCASISVSDCAGAWFRRLTVLGEKGRLSIDDGGYEWIDEHGEPLETAAGSHRFSPGELIGMQMTRLLEQRDAAAPASSAFVPPDTARLLALCEAARLSCRTGDGETPQRLLEMLSKP